MLSEITEDGIKKLVDTFYGKIRAHEELGPIFNRAIPEEAWPGHLNKLCDFWSSVMLKTGRYHGNPPLKHKELPPFPPEMFDRWLALFAETAREIFEPVSARHFVNASEIIAGALKQKIYSYKKDA